MRSTARAANVRCTCVHSRERRSFVHPTPTPTPTQFCGGHLHLARPLKVTRGQRRAGGIR